MQTFEDSNWRQVEALNQRGGRTLSMADLICARTLSPEAAGYLGQRISRGASLLTAAKPGGAGKTALLAALLGFLPAGLEIATVESPRVVAEASQEIPSRCYLAHEIGAGHWYGYIWGSSVAPYLSLARGPHRIASCLHADTLDELYEQLTGPPLAVSEETLLAIDFVLFIQIVRAPRGAPCGRLHRVTAIYESNPAARAHELIFAWNRTEDKLLPAAPVTLHEEAQHLAQFLHRTAQTGPYEWNTFRTQCLHFRQTGSVQPPRSGN